MKLDGKKILGEKILITNPLKRKREIDPIDDISFLSTLDEKQKKALLLTKYKKKKEKKAEKKAEKKKKLAEEEELKKKENPKIETKKIDEKQTTEKKVEKKIEAPKKEEKKVKNEKVVVIPSKPIKSESEIKNEKYAAKQDRKKGTSKDHMVYVHNLSLYTKKKDLKDFFSKCGEIEKIKFPTQSDQKSKGFAFITFSEKLGAQKAILKNGDSVKNREIVVEECQEMKEK